MANCLICGGESQAIQMHKGCFDAMLAGLLMYQEDCCPICSRREECGRTECRFSSDLFMLRMRAAEGRADLDGRAPLPRVVYVLLSPEGK